MSKKGAKIVRKKHQNSQRVLKKAQIGRFRTIHEEIVELPIESIQPCPFIPDYREPTKSTLPIIVLTPAGYFCIDGFDLIELAKATGLSAVRCHVYHIKEHSDTELAIRKVEIRTRPQGGNCSFAELVLNTRLLEQIILKETENPIVFSHGGARRGKNFTNDKDNDLREILAERLGKKRTTINQYLNLGNNLNLDALSSMAEADTGKVFFEEVQFKKRDLIDRLENDGMTSEAITDSVSSKMLEWLDKYRQPVKLSKNKKSQPLTPPSENQTQQDETQQETPKTEKFKHWSGNFSASQEKMPTEDEVCLQLKGIASTLAEVADNKDLTVQQRIEAASAQIIQLSMLIQELKHLGSQTKVEKEEKS